MARQGRARQGGARQGQARCGMARSGEARQGSYPSPKREIILNLMKGGIKR